MINISGIIYLSLCVWLILLSILSSGFIHVVACVRPSLDATRDQRGKHQAVRKQKGKEQEVLGYSSYQSFPGKVKAGRSKQFRISLLE